MQELFYFFYFHKSLAVVTNFVYICDMKSLSQYLKENNDVLDTSLFYNVHNLKKDVVKLKSVTFNKFKHKDLDGYEKYRNSYVTTDKGNEIPTTLISIK